MNKSPAEILKLACEKAQAASDAELARREPSNSWFPCGFAWVKIRPARGKLVNYLKSIGVGGTDSYAGGYRVSSYDICSQPGSWAQQMDIKYAGCSAFAEVLRDHGVNAYADSRMD